MAACAVAERDHMQGQPRVSEPSTANAPARHSVPDPSIVPGQLYGPELGRMTSYRRRLDTSTNWAISVVSAAVALVLGTDTMPHTVILVAMLVTLFFLLLESERFRQYEVSRVRVALLECGYFSDVLRGATSWPWLEQLIDQLQHPRPPLDRWTALGWRLKRNYLWIYLVLLVAWLFKLEVLGSPSANLDTLLYRASAGWLPGWAVFAGLVAFYLSLILLTIRAVRRYPHAEDW